MRQRIDDRAKKPSPIILEKIFKEIVVGTGRSQEPYIIAFHYASDNVAGHGLGTLFGFFEVEIHDQDGAYIVNFLASVAKKEYFANPKRSPVDSFDAALHKINVALAEIVKHGNISWLGHLHGAIGAVNENAFHFSVTGDGSIYLARQEALNSISEGLADTESEPHPLKTFTEVSSGDLYDGDLVLALSPSIWSLFSPEDLRRSLNRLGPVGFEQFLRTALVNELPVAAAGLLLCAAPINENVPSESPEKKEARSKKAAISLENVWSGKPFHEASQSKAPVVQREETTPKVEMREEYTDQKTGHIYVQASSDRLFEAPSGHWKETLGIWLHHFDAALRSGQVSVKKSARRLGKGTSLALARLGAWLALVRRSVGRRIRLGKRDLGEKWQHLREARQAKKAALGKETASFAPLPHTAEPIITPITQPVLGAAALTRLKDALSWTIVAGRMASRRFFNLIKNTFDRLSFWGGRFWSKLSGKQRLSLLGAILIISGAFFVFNRSANVTDIAPPEAASEITVPSLSAFPPVDEPLSILLSGSRPLFPTNNSRSLSLTAINQLLFLVTERAIIDLKTQASTATPEPLRLAAPMDDLDAIFALGTSGKLYLYSITTKKFEENIIPTPAGITIDAIGAYLTYLYVLDRKAGVIYRFPRAEGGFGAPTLWSKETLSLSEKNSFTVYENILLTNTDDKPMLYSRGRNAEIIFTGTQVTTAADILSFDTKTGDVFALDRTHKRIIRWSATGTLINQYYHDSFDSIEAFAVSPEGNELLTSSQGATSAWRI